ncbi:unnamed protein product [Caenorhabditis angaria]|uniref:Uncharacterized protein n=1 Tax=Caenorhabditis angaria TaxID=860376 RepID=A0A9P1MWU9_9PELO|nr:unnamed protein product [Caenorhabditis angaria]
MFCELKSHKSSRMRQKKMEGSKMLSLKDRDELVRLLFTSSPEMVELYESPQKLIQDLYSIQKLANNSQFVGLEDELNYLSEVIVFKDRTNTSFLSIFQLYIRFCRETFAKHDELILQLMGESMGNKMYRELKGKSFELLSEQSYLEHVNTYCNSSKREYPKKLPAVFKKTSLNFEDIYTLLSQFFDKQFDGKLLEKLKIELKSKNQVLPISKNRMFYQELYLLHYSWQKIIEIALNHDKLLKTESLNPFVRFFKEGPNMRFCFAIELENALKIACNAPLPKGILNIETTEDRKNGILKTVKWEKFKNILETLELTLDDIHVINQKFQTTNRGTCVPIDSPYGTYCKLAKHSFFDVFDQISSGMHLFRNDNDKILAIVSKWFKKLEKNVFISSESEVYFIETWKIEQLINQAYVDLEKYGKEPIYQIQRQKTYTKNEVLKELFKLSPTLRIQAASNDLSGNNNKFNSRDIMRLFEKGVLEYFIQSNKKYSSFLNNQEGKNDYISNLFATDKELIEIINAKCGNSKIYEVLKKRLDGAGDFEKTKLLDYMEKLKLDLEN